MRGQPGHNCKVHRKALVSGSFLCELCCGSIRGSSASRAHRFAIAVSITCVISRNLLAAMSHSRRGSITPPNNPRSPSPYLSPIAGGDQNVYDSGYDVEMHSASHPISPSISEGQGGEYEMEIVTCQWLDCRKPFSQLQALIDHIHNGACRDPELNIS